MSPQTWTDRAVHALRSLGERPVALLLVVLAFNALCLPYCGLIHDARLYSFQVLQYRDGSHGDDLFFKYGSQDKYSLFSPAVAPLTRVLGLEPTFFLLYLIFNTLFLWALQQLIFALIKDRLAAVFSLLLMAMLYVPFAGRNIFHVNETFLTPRIMANALVFLALERMLRGRLVVAFLSIAGALVLHPLMAFSGFLILCGWCLYKYLSIRTATLVVTAAALATIVLLLSGGFASRYLGTMDDAWRESVRAVNPYHFPLEWLPMDWVKVALALAIAGLTVRHLSGDPDRKRFVLVMMVVAVLGLAGGTLACFLPYALPMQGQAWRSLWLLQFLQIPLAVFLARKWWCSGVDSLRAAAIFLIGFGLMPLVDVTFFFLLGAAFGFLLLVHRGLGREPHQQMWVTPCTIGALVFAWCGWVAIKALAISMLWADVTEYSEPLDLVRLMVAIAWPIYPVILLMTLVKLINTVSWNALNRISLGCFLAIQCCFFAIPLTAWYRQHTPNDNDLQFVEAFLKSRPGDNTPTVYWPVHRIRYLWIDLGVNSYFEWPHQVAGNLFSRQTALEGVRRAQIVRRFELHRFQQENPELMSDDLKKTLQNVFQADLTDAVPGIGDLAQLSTEQGLDYIVVPHAFDNLYSASNGSYFIYDCRHVRQVLQQRSPSLTANVALATSPLARDH